MTLHHLYLLAPGAAPEEIRRFYETTLGLREVQPPVSLAAVPVFGSRRVSLCCISDTRPTAS